MDDVKQGRYYVSALANLLLAMYFLLLYYHLHQYKPSFSIGMLLLGIGFGIKFLADWIYGNFLFENKGRFYFHLLSGIYYLIASGVMISFAYFGYTLSYTLGAMLLILGIFNVTHAKSLEEEVWRVRRHLSSVVFKWFTGSLAFFDCLFYNILNPSLYGVIVTLLGTFTGIWCIYTSIVIYRYIRDTSKIPLTEAL